MKIFIFLIGKKALVIKPELNPPLLSGIMTDATDQGWE